MVIKYKAGNLIEDFNLNAKTALTDLSDMFKTEIKKATVLSEEQCNEAFDFYSKQGKDVDFASYLAPKAAEKVQEAPKAAPVEAPTKATAPQTPAEKPAAPQTPVEKPAAPQAQAAKPAAPQTPAPKKPINDNGYRPQPGDNSYRPRDNGYKPQPNHPNDNGYRPQDNGYKPQPQYQQNGYKAQPSAPSGPRVPQQPNKFQQQGKAPVQQQNRQPVQNVNQPRPAQQGNFSNEPLKRADGTIVERQVHQKPKSELAGQGAQKQERVVVTVDTRQTNVNMDKFNEKYDELAKTKTFNAGQRKNTSLSNKQKFNKNRNNSRPNPFAKKKVETEAERLERMHLEKARKAQLKVQIPEEISVGELATRLKVSASEVIKRLMAVGIMAAQGEIVDFDTAALVAEELGAKVEKEVVVTIEERLFEEIEDTQENTETRPPVVVVMGHVDHGKTSLLDAIRKTTVTKGEAGGITQHIGAYQVECNGKTITFLDTPGHEAFTSMRQRGAFITDIAVLVVAADDGIMPQTIEAINHAKAAGVTIIVAINKIDKPTANIDKVKQALTEYELVTEEWGGSTICVPVSAHTGEGIDTLLEMINLTSDVAELKANKTRRAKGTVIEARLDKGLGPVATILVQNGTLYKGDILIAGTTVGRVRAMTNDKGERIDEAGPSTPVEITGLTDVPSAGDIFDAVEDEKLARELAERRMSQMREERFSSYQKVTLDNLFSQIAQGEMKELAIIVKADVQGSAEAVKQSLEKLSNEEVRVKVIHSAVGAISKSDIMLASASNAIVIGFNVRPDAVAKQDAEHDHVEMRMYRVIYDAIEDVKSAMKGMLEPKFREVELGQAEVRTVYKISTAGTIAGCYVKEGKVARHAKIRVVRDGIVITEDEISSLKRFKDDQKEVAAGYECGIGLEKFGDIKEGDIFESFIIEEYRD
ncbi:MAG: translation initiation factor IF-2 [Oscillospiraceae bacterium]